jgi:hypothetical protein
MNEFGFEFSLKRVYWIALAIGLIGAIAYIVTGGVRLAIAFLAGVLLSCGNLWLFDWVSQSIAPDASTRKPWQAGAYVSRYLLLVGIGYVIVKGLDVSPLAVVLGLLASTAAVLSSLIFEIISQLFRGKASH